VSATELTSVAGDIRAYERCLIEQIARRLDGQFVAAVELLMAEPGDAVRIALTITLACDQESGGMIQPEMALRRTETSEKCALTPFRVGQLSMSYEEG
jgi:hypothetical protein